MYSSAVVHVDYPDNSVLIVQTILKAGMTAGKHSAAALPIVDFNLQLARK
jgi:hypothetical protein